ncbi:MAG TPA: trypsin-like peptidase domain-containing protein [Paenibacillaceae bacterium]
MDDQNRKPDDWYTWQYRSDQTESRSDAQPSFSPASVPGRSLVTSGTSSGGGADDPYRERPQTRPFTVSGGVRYWEPAPARRGGGLFRTIFASFLAGAILVGGLMFAADHFNWFTSQTAGPSQTTEGRNDVRPVVDSSGGSGSALVEDVVRPNTIAEIFEKANPAVVKIVTYTRTTSRPLNPFLDDFWFFFEDYFGGQDNGGSLRETGMGSGFFFDSNGYILTNQHVISGADEIQVQVIGYQEPFKAQLLGSSYELDLAVLKIEGKNFPTLPLGDSDKMKIGDWVIAIGNPYGFDHTLTVGVISAKERPIPINDGGRIRQYENLLQTDASINPGNSGGPLLNLNGEVIGINTAVSAQAQGIGFAIPTSTILEVLEQLKNNEQPPAPFIGVNLMNLTPELAERLGLEGTEGALVQGVLYGSPAYEADIRQYDVITGMDGKTYKTREELIKAIQSRKVGETVTLHIIRAGKKIDVQVKIGDRNEYERR